ncbi:Uncharacterized protein OBRU01_08856 [Operophtera brumata]|uniref:Uncharacterized protein n=1 Tax=Operophtera brumata TaxID=104452 RepID=A0A0L7LDK5_OPEBR|nr:Uncharacterized protein OBRU01_08856 [Operophtera brumata]
MYLADQRGWMNIVATLCGVLVAVCAACWRRTPHEDKPDDGAECRGVYTVSADCRLSQVSVSASACGVLVAVCAACWRRMPHEDKPDDGAECRGTAFTPSVPTAGWARSVSVLRAACCVLVTVCGASWRHTAPSDAASTHQ